MADVRKFKADYHWDQVDSLKYKEEGTHFKDITRQILFAGSPELPGQLRYFEILPNGHSTLERHAHLHVVMVIRGEGEALVGSEVVALGLLDVLHIPAKTWHQFQAKQQAFGFLCLVNIERDRPERPNEEQWQALQNNPRIAKFIKK